jgi:riboflavin kinase
VSLSNSVKKAYFSTLLELALLGAKDKHIRISSKELAEKVGKSQQAGSKNLVDLEREGLIERTRSGNATYVKLTEKGFHEVSRLYLSLREAFEGVRKPLIELKGRVFSGMGEAAYYVSLSGYRKQFIRKLGFDPFPGTLNVKLMTVLDRNNLRFLDNYEGLKIEGFEDGKRTFGGAKCFPAVINGKLGGDLIILERTTYDESVAELIAPVKIRSALDLEDGDEISIAVTLPNGNISSKDKLNQKKAEEDQF